MNRGAGNMDAVVILAILIVMVVMGARTTPSKSRSFVEQNQNPTTNKIYTANSVYNRSISLGRGNAAYAIQPYEEYITLRNRGDNPVSITGWQLRNGKDERGYSTNSGLRFFPADTGFIPRGALILSLSGNNFLQEVVL